MTSDRDALLAAVLANPEEDTPRLMLADEIQADGGVANEARAAFVRGHAPCLACLTTGGFEDRAGEFTGCYTCVGRGWRPFCEHEGCRRAGKACEIDEPFEGDPNHAVDLVEHFCDEHAALHGFCPGCGRFWGGVSSFEVSGICDECRLAADDECDFDEDLEGWFGPDDFGEDHS